MAHSLLNTSPVLHGRVTLPRQGVWHADLVLEAESAPTGAVTLKLGAALSLRGVVQHGGVFAGQVRVRVVGGAGLLATELEPRWYVGAPRELPLRDMVEEAGERLSSACDPALLGEVLEGWTRVRGTAAAALARLLDGTGASWRLLPDGTLWAGPETWPQAQGMPDLLVLEEDRTAGRLLLATEAPQLLPGQTLRGDKVSDVEITIEPEQLRVEALLERSTPGVGDRLKGAFLALVEGLIRRRTDYLGSYLGTVVRTDASGRLEVKLDDTARPPVTSVVLRAGLPGTELKLLDGCRVLVSWQGGSPRFPIAQPWDEGGLRESRTTASEKITLNSPQVVLDESGRQVARLGDMVAVGGPTVLVQFVPLPGNASPTLLPGVPYGMLFTNVGSATPVPQPTLFGTILTGNARVRG